MVASCVFVLIVSFILQPLHRAYADTEGSEVLPEATAVIEASALESVVPEVDPEPEEVVEEEVEAGPVTETEVVTVDSNETATPPSPTDATSTEEASSIATPVASTSLLATDTATSTEAADSDTDNATSTGAVTDVETIFASTTATTSTPVIDAVTTTVATSSENSTATSTPETPSDTTATGTATSSDTETPNATPDSPADTPDGPEDLGATSAEPTAEDEVASSSTASTSSSTQMVVIEHNNEQNAHQFAQEDCVMAGNGSYYCTKQANESFAESGVFAAPDSDGDMEIYVRVNGESVQLTNNQYDDSSPYYDAVSERVVWHSLRNDRYQIVAYDFTTEREQVLTQTSYNNMEPVAFGDLVAWQAWRGGDWEIMLYDGTATMQISNNEVNDVAPSMYAGFVMWQAQYAEGSRLAVYDVTTGVVEYLNDTTSEVASAENPRLMLLYDQVDGDGTVATIGFDVRTGELAPVTNTPAPMPERLPSPEEPGTQKALVHAQPSVREGDDEVVAPPSDDSNPVPSVATSTDDTTLVITNFATTTTALTAQATSSDVVVPEAAATSTLVSRDSIPDVVIGAPSSTTDETYE